MSQPPTIQAVEPPRWLNLVQGIAGIVIGLLLMGWWTSWSGCC
jgi:hypothetical protein